MVVLKAVVNCHWCTFYCFLHAVSLFKGVLMSDFRVLTYLKRLQYLVYDQRYMCPWYYAV